MNDKIIRIENKILDFLQKNLIMIMFIIITILAFAIRYKLRNFQSDDYNYFLSSWFNTVQEKGGLVALKENIGDYNIPYLVMIAILTYLPISSLFSIKAVSIIFDFIGALAVAKLVNTIVKKEEKSQLISLIAYTVFLFMPTVWLNSAAWAQCDIIYTTFILISLIYLLKEKYVLSFIFLGMAFAFKLQTILIVPLYLYVWLSKREFPIYYFGIILIIWILSCLPACFFGRGLVDCMAIYFHQTEEWADFSSLNFPNVYSLIFKVDGNDCVIKGYGAFETIGIIIMIAIFAIMASILFYRKVRLNKIEIIELSIWSIMLATYLLPHMHERYTYVAEALSLVYLLIKKDRQSAILFIGMTFIILTRYIRYLFEFQILDLKMVAILNSILVFYLSAKLFKKFLYGNTREEKEIEK